MASALLPSALDVSTRTFPTLTPEQIQRVRAAGRVRKVERGEILFEPGDLSIPFFVLLAGAMEIVQPSTEGERVVATHGPGVHGELNMVSGRRSLVRARVTEPGEFLELSGDEFRSLVARDAEAFAIVRR
jgi:thioredoxin reductase (NADPH)